MSISPVVDFDGDGIAGTSDICIMIHHWGTDEPWCDIGPTPFGDGTVDVNDLEVLMSHWGQEIHDPHLLAHWKLDETEGTVASDSADNQDGSVIGAPAWRPAGGVLDGALEFDGTTLVAADFVLNPCDGPLSVFAWVKGGAPGEAIISQAAGANWLALDPATSALTTELKGSGRLSQG
ncbi:MAG: hypothetical protein ACYTAS_07980, partial [Planctomycetota bacterium]